MPRLKKNYIPKTEIKLGKDLIEQLSISNPILTPTELKKFVPDYLDFTPHESNSILWSTTKTKIKLNQNQSKFERIAVLISGPSSSGKDAIKDEMIKIAPNLFHNLVTGTSRPPRSDEVHGQHYFFYESVEIFKESVSKGEFIEWIIQGGRYYGLPKKSIDTGLKSNSPIIMSQIEISSWNRIEKHFRAVTNHQVPVIKLFVLPHMNFSEYKSWLIQKRADQFEKRLHRTGWELHAAPKKTDFIVMNKFSEDTNSLTTTAQVIVNQLKLLLK